MGNKPCHDEFKSVLPSESPAKVHASRVSDSQSNTDVCCRPSSHFQTTEKHPTANSVTKIPHISFKTIVPSHTLQQNFNENSKNDDPFLIPESVRRSQTLNAHVDVCSEILPSFLYVSNVHVAQDKTKLRSLGITHILNCCAEYKWEFNDIKLFETSDDAEFQMLELSLRDDATEDLTPFLPQVLVWIANLRQQLQSQEKTSQIKILLHCYQGVSRSCALAIAYLMLEQQMTYQEAASMVKRQRAISSPNAAFICQLLEWEKELQAMRIGGMEFQINRLYRLTPHSFYDPETLVLKQCYTASIQNEQNRVIVKTVEDEQQYLWSYGTFVYQNWNQVRIWHGSKCRIFEAVAKAIELARQLFQILTLAQSFDTAVKPRDIIVLTEGTDGLKGTEIDHFGYATELQWTHDLDPNWPQRFFLPTDAKATTSRLRTNQTNVIPIIQLYRYKGIDDQSIDVWEQLTNYDSEDLTSDCAFLLISTTSEDVGTKFVWIGISCLYSHDEIVQAAQKQLHCLVLEKQESLPSIQLEFQNNESETFWEVFEAGY
ncbi:dual specificity catalytic domain containing protein [Plasmopara halstedii]|uniref:Dual specificity catalytic domain containing protein n=1 Tax=Plasmopara halstedii TaxID=4781 RepID=A0A0P1ANH5_PLAHL|nr:dual specificity catalytic domain containing protein [Plasmopara halstedii]CEG42743.1 dual specificity catalytic domain containing protein [Plasmopara halstedii]|eukprot:XP_024579112.1 dual specificity catalytic domain containing protein [Plasmopara halstedii]